MSYAKLQPLVLLIVHQSEKAVAILSMSSFSKLLNLGKGGKNEIQTARKYNSRCKHSGSHSEIQEYMRSESQITYSQQTSCSLHEANGYKNWNPLCQINILSTSLTS